MGEPYWPIWAVIPFVLSGAFSAWLVTVARRPARTTRPNCGRYAKVVTLRDHWKECMS